MTGFIKKALFFVLFLYGFNQPNLISTPSKRAVVDAFKIHFMQIGYDRPAGIKQDEPASQSTAVSASPRGASAETERKATSMLYERWAATLWPTMSPVRQAIRELDEESCFDMKPERSWQTPQTDVPFKHKEPGKLLDGSCRPFKCECKEQMLTYGLSHYWNCFEYRSLACRPINEFMLMHTLLAAGTICGLTATVFSLLMPKLKNMFGKLKSKNNKKIIESSVNQPNDTKKSKKFSKTTIFRTFGIGVTTLSLIGLFLLRKRHIRLAQEIRQGDYEPDYSYCLSSYFEGGKAGSDPIDHEARYDHCYIHYPEFLSMGIVTRFLNRP